MSEITSNESYLLALADIFQRIAAAQVCAVLAMNDELLAL